MSAAEQELDLAAVTAALQSTSERPGAIERAVGLNTSTGMIKCVHLMNDLAQQVVGGAPDHRGDFLCRVIRTDHDGTDPDDKEDNSDATLRADDRFGATYRQAFPPALGAGRTAAARDAVGLLLNFDGGVYRAGDAMASGLATHWTLLGYEGFCRFGLGGALAAALGSAGREQVKALFHDAGDPVSRALRPVMLDGALTERKSGRGIATSSPFDEAVGSRISNLLQHALSKPAKLRALGLAGVLWAVLRVLGAGQPGGRPTLVALPSQWSALGGKLRQPAVQSFARCVAGVDAAVAAELADEDALGLSLTTAAASIVALRESKPGKAGQRVYWPDAFAAALGRKVGCVGPASDKLGWGKYLCFTPDLLEVVILMLVAPGGAPRSWQDLWAEARRELGVVIGSDPHEDETALRAVGVNHINLEDLEHNADLFLEQACSRGVARRLPDGDAEAGVAVD